MCGPALRRALRLVAVLAVLATRCRAQQPDPVELVTAAIANAQRDFVVSQGYASQDFLEWRYYDKHGAMFLHKTWQFDVVFVGGDWYLRPTARNGNPLTGAEAEREQKNWDEMISGMRARLAPDFGCR